MTSARVYRPAMLPSQALRVIRQLRDIQFNNEVANHLINSVALYPVGSRVQLTSLEIGIVVDVNTAERDRPIVRVLFQADGRKYRNPYEVDLAKRALSGNYQNSAVTRSVGDHAEELARQYLEKQD